MRFDDGFALYARACLNSIKENYPNHPQLIIDYSGNDRRLTDTLVAMRARILPPEPPPEYTRHLKKGRVGQPVFDRFRLWRSAFRSFDTILHLDADTLVLHPLDDLFEKPHPFFVANHEASAGVQVFDPVHDDNDQLTRMLCEDGLPALNAPDDMVNAGVFTLPSASRTPGNIALLARLARRYGRYLAFADQSLLSLWLAALGQRPSTDFADNFQTPFFTAPDVPVAQKDIRILHFSSHRKPGTHAFETWDRVGPARAWIMQTFERYAGDTG